MRASLYLFSTNQPVAFYPPTASAEEWNLEAQPGPVVDLFPLIRLSFDSPWPAEVAHAQSADVCPGRGRDFAYANSVGMFNEFRTWDLCNYAAPNAPAEIAAQRYKLDQVEGFLLAACPSGWACDGRASEGGLQPVFVRARKGPIISGQPPNEVREQPQDWVVLLQEQLGTALWLEHTEKPPFAPEGPLGYAFKNLDRDSDLLVDGVELMIGTNPLDSDTDNDGLRDGEEYSPRRGSIQYFGPITVNTKPLPFATNPRIDDSGNRIFRNGFEP
jgi:hypothetical protein